MYTGTMYQYTETPILTLKGSKSVRFFIENGLVSENCENRSKPYSREMSRKIHFCKSSS